MFDNMVVFHNAKMLTKQAWDDSNYLEIRNVAGGNLSIVAHLENKGIGVTLNQSELEELINILTKFRE